MKYIALIGTTAALFFFNPLLGSLFWVLTIANIHAEEEKNGSLWAYFGKITGAGWLENLSPWLGYLLIVIPALVLQNVAAFGAFGGETVRPFWLALLIGARSGDAIFSHIVPVLRGFKSSPEETAAKSNPGLPTGLIYFADSIALALIFHGPLLAASRETLISGFAIGAGFFAVIQPLLHLTSKIKLK